MKVKTAIQRPSLVKFIRLTVVVLFLDCCVVGYSYQLGKEKEKFKKFQDLGREVDRLWNVRVYVVPEVVDGCGIATDNLGIFLDTIEVTANRD